MEARNLAEYNDSDFRRLTGISRDVYSLMLETLKTYEQKYRSKKGRKSKLSLDNQLLLTLLYWKHYSSMLLLAHFGGIDETTVGRMADKIERILRASGRFKMPEHLLSEASSEQICLVDATEVETQRPTEHQEDVYSGKKKAHF